MHRARRVRPFPGAELPWAGIAELRGPGCGPNCAPPDAPVWLHSEVIRKSEVTGWGPDRIALAALGGGARAAQVRTEAERR